MKKKILHISHSLDIGGGPLYIEKIVHDIDGFDYFVAGTEGNYFYAFQKVLGHDKVFRLTHSNIIANVFIIYRICNKHKIDIVHAHGRGASMYTRLLKILRPKTQILYTIHGFFPQLLSLPVRWFYLLAENLLYGLTDRFIHVSKSELQLFKNSILSPRDNKHLYIPNYIDLGRSGGQDHLMSFLARHPNFRKTSPNILFVGRLVPQKGVDFLVRVIAKVTHPTAHFFIVGYGPMEHDLAALDPHKFSYLGKVEGASELMNAFDALILPSRLEGMPFTLLEAMKARIAVITTPVAGIIDVVDSETAYMAKTLSEFAILEAVQSFLHDYENDKDEIAKRVDRSYIRLSEEFCKEKVALNFKRLYNNQN